MLGVAVSFVLSGAAALVVAVVMTALTSWMLAGSRGWIDRLVRWHVLAPSTPDRLARLQLRWALCLLPLLVVAWSRLFQLVAGLAPGVFSGAAVGEVNYPSTLVFVLENLLHTQIFVDTFEVYGVRIADMRQEGFLGGLLTFLLRLVLNLGIIELLVSFGMVWFNRVFRKFAVSPNAELALRKEVVRMRPASGGAGWLSSARGAWVSGGADEAAKGRGDAGRAGGEWVLQGCASRTERLERSQTSRGRQGMRPRRSPCGNRAGWKRRSPSTRPHREILERLVREGRDDLRNDLAGDADEPRQRPVETRAGWKRQSPSIRPHGRSRSGCVREGRDDLRNDLAEDADEPRQRLANRAGWRRRSPSTRPHGRSRSGWCARDATTCRDGLARRG